MESEVIDMRENKIISEKRRKEFGARSLADVKQRGTPIAQPNLSELDSALTELRRAEFSEQQIKIEKRAETILVLGRENIIVPCNDCPMADSRILCTDRNRMSLDEGGSLACPDGKGVIRILSI